MRVSIESKFDFKEVTELENLFKEKEWSKIEDYENFFENFCKFLEVLNEEQTNLIKELTSEFLWITDNQYYKRLRESLLQLSNYPELDLSKIFIVPLLTHNDRNKSKTKSSTRIAYCCQNHQFKNIEIFKGTTFKIIDNPDRLPRATKLETRKNPIILVDDFIGTGETAITAIEEIRQLQNYSNNILFIASLVCQEEGFTNIRDTGVNILCSVIRQKGLSNKYEGEELKEKVEIMNSIENVLSTDVKFDRNTFGFGYGKSEALVTLTRTPNNTFPVYWYEASLENGKKWCAPFPR